MSTTERRQKVVKSHPGLSLEKQCELLEIHRSGLYYKPKGESALNLALMKRIDSFLKENKVWDEETIKKAKEYMERMKNSGKEYNPAPKGKKTNDRKIQK